MDMKFGRSYLSEDLKADRTISSIFSLQLDVVFIQEVTQHFVNKVEK
jgi:hypothetical protein